MPVVSWRDYNDGVLTLQLELLVWLIYMAEASSNAVIAARTMERSGWAESIRTIKE
jgi:hypothetical protein